jgi:protein required for attachment to host cells
VNESKVKFLQQEGQDDDLSSTGQKDEPIGDEELYKTELGPRPDLARDLASPSQHKLQRERRYSSTMNTARDRNPHTPLAQESANLADFE